jgi:CubicO group peptidase (beta-lactamase class C family)
MTDIQRSRADDRALETPGGGAVRRTSSSLIALTGLLGALAGCATAPIRPAEIAHDDYAYAKRYLTWFIEQEMSKHDVTGLSIALVDDQQVVWARGFGFADKARNLPAAPETVYRVGSISKLFTATAAMQLAERGKLDIDRPLATYLPGFSIKSRFPEAGPITPRTLMTHHAGLPSNRLKGSRGRNLVAFSGLASELSDEFVAYPPNFMFAYSNLGMTLLGEAVGQVSGLGFSAYVERELLQPLGMGRSSISSAAEAPLMAKPYDRGKPVEEPGIRNLPAGGLNTSVLDLSHLLAMVFAGGRFGAHQLITEETLAEMLRPQNADVPLDLEFRIGLGWFLMPMGLPNAGPVVSHGGDVINYHSQLVALPQHKLGVIVLSNSASSAETVRRVATEALKLALETKTGIRQPRPPEATSEDETPPSAEERRAAVGAYVTGAGLVRVTDEAGELRVSIAGKVARLAHFPSGHLKPKFKLWGVIPVESPLTSVAFSVASLGGREVLIGTKNGQSRIFGEKVAPSPLPPELERYLGTYELANLGVGEWLIFRSIRVEYHDGFLLADLAGRSPEDFAKLVLLPVSSHEAIIAGLGRGFGETIHFRTGAEGAVISFSGLEFKKTPKP